LNEGLNIGFRTSEKETLKLWEDVMEIMFILERQAKKSGGDRYFAALESGENWTVYFPQEISRDSEGNPKKAIQVNIEDSKKAIQVNIEDFMSSKPETKSEEKPKTKKKKATELVA